MVVVYTTTWKREGSFPMLKDVLRPRILAAGYDLQAEDEGKQVYSLPTKNRMALMVSYILTPRATEIELTWYAQGKYWSKEEADWAFGLAKRFYAYLAEWLKAAGELEASDEGEQP
jgi:hypothetical protein